MQAHPLQILKALLGQGNQLNSQPEALEPETYLESIEQVQQELGPLPTQPLSPQMRIQMESLSQLQKLASDLESVRKVQAVILAGMFLFGMGEMLMLVALGTR